MPDIYVTLCRINVTAKPAGRAYVCLMKMIPTRFAALLVLPLIGLAPPPALAEDLGDVTRLTLLPGWQAEDGSFVAAVRVDLAPGWKTYWREPGAAGIAPQFDWSGSRNVANARVIWPTPEVFDDASGRTIGFAHQMTVPVIITPANPAEPVSLSLTADYGVCKDICVPAHGTALTDILRDALDNQAAILTALESAPRSATQVGISGVSCHVAPQGEDFSLRVEIAFADAPQDASDVIVELGNTDTWVAETSHHAAGNTLTVDAEIMYFGTAPYQLDHKALRLTVLDAEGAIDIRGCDL